MLSATAGEDGFRFGHVLIRDVAYEAMPKQLRAELHERFPDWIERNAGDRGQANWRRSSRTTSSRPIAIAPSSARPTSARRSSLRAPPRCSAGRRRAFAQGDMPAAVTCSERALALGGGEPEARLDLAGAL